MCTNDFTTLLLVILWPMAVYTLARVLYLDKENNKLSQIQTDIDNLQSNEAALETRVTAHEQNLKDTAAALQAQIDALKAAGVSPDQLKSLEDLAGKMAAFDPDVV